MKLVIWDSTRFANNNGEYLYRKIQEKYPEIQQGFLLSKDSKDWDRLSKDGFNLIAADDTHLVEKCLSEATYILFTNNALPQLKKYRNKTIYIPHGISSYLNEVGDYWNKSIVPNARYVCVSFRDEQKIVEKICGNRIQVLPFGYPRHDILLEKHRLHQCSGDDRKRVFISFHWRRYIDCKTAEQLQKSAYVRGIDELLNCRGLKTLADSGVQISFLPHLAFMKYCRCFKVPSWIDMPVGTPFQDLLVQSDVLVTDFSSNSFEMAYMDKPSIVYVPDRKCKYRTNPYCPNQIGRYENLLRCDDIDGVCRTLNTLFGEKQTHDFSDRLFFHVDDCNVDRLVDWMNKKNGGNRDV